MITEDYVSFEIAKLLKEKGFDEATNRYYNAQCCQIRTVSDTFMWHWNNEEFMKRVLMEGAIAIPTLQMAMKWLREVHNILVVIDYNYECTSKSYCYKIYTLGENGKPKRFPVYGVSYDDEGNANKDIIYYRDFQLSDSEYTTYEETAEAAIYYCLEYLI